MNKIIEFECTLKELKVFSKKLALITKVSDIFLLRGDLGAGKTTFARALINSLFEYNKVPKPANIKSPSFPIMINYSLLNNEIYHYDLYRISKLHDLSEIGIFEEIEKNIYIIEWPEILLKSYIIKNYYLMELQIISSRKRLIKLFHTTKTKF